MSGTAPGMNSTSSSPGFTPRVSSKMRVPAIRSLSSKRSFWSKLGDFWQRAAQVTYNAVNKALTIGSKFDHQYSFKLPGPGSRKGNLRQEESPWGKATLLKRFKDSEGRGGHLVKMMDIYCVGCGVVGHSKVAGRAKWSPRDGLSEGHIELTASLQVALKLGIYGTATLEHHINLDFFNVGLPGLSYGVITIGPYVSLGAHVGLTAGASGKILAGAEMNWQDARVVLDYTGSNKFATSGWTSPTFKPVFEAAGDVFASAELGLPVGLKVGLKVSKWEAAVGVVDEPSIKATARVGLSTSPKPGPIGNNTLTVGFGDQCAGIMTEISWRNRLWVGGVSSTDVPWLDSGDSSLLGKCIGKSTPLRRAEAIDPGNTPQSQPLQPSPESDQPVQQLTYAPSTMSPKLYDESSAASALTHLLNPHESTRLLSCTNGNIYAVRNDNSTNDFCSSDWETTTQHRVVVRDAFRRPMLYYGDTMSTLGVSRLRTSNADMAPKTGVAVALVPLRDEEGETQNKKREQKKEAELELYVAMDPSGEVFYPVVCDYVDRESVSKVFLVRDMEDGLEVLKRGDVVRSVTGGEVEKCVLLAIKAGV
ncbi:hypothetical protein E4U61_007245 [Claviceps capensis]|nr:hypothetical protein E4U61_007245 [Claviceps capensis]